MNLEAALWFESQYSQFLVGSAIALLGVAVTLVVYFLQRQVKELACGVVSYWPLLSIADEVASRVTIQLDGIPVTNLHLTVYGIKNSGTKAIASDDFERPLTISLSSGKVVSATIHSQSPSSLGAELTVAETTIELAPLLLNCGDQLLIKVLSTGESNAGTLDARIVDVPRLAKVDGRPFLPPFWQSGVPIMMGIMLAGTVVMYLLKQDPTVFLLTGGMAALMGTTSALTRLFERAGPFARRRVNGAISGNRTSDDVLS